MQVWKSARKNFINLNLQTKVKSLKYFCFKQRGHECLISIYKTNDKSSVEETLIYLLDAIKFVKVNTIILCLDLKNKKNFYKKLKDIKSLTS